MIRLRPRPPRRRKHLFWSVALFTALCAGAILLRQLVSQQPASLPVVTDGDSAQIENQHGRKLLELYPPEAFSLSEYPAGILLYVLGVIYCFLALAIVCDDFFVPALEVLTEKLKLSDDVAGATFMAAGGSMPELFTSFIGVFFAESEVGLGTIVGSAVFNVLFVIGMCAIFSKELLKLTWWPLARDVSFYILSLGVLVGFFADGEIAWWEALVLLLCYALYVLIMRNNIALHKRVSRMFGETDEEYERACRQELRAQKIHVRFRAGVSSVVLANRLGAKTTHKQAEVVSKAIRAFTGSLLLSRKKSLDRVLAGKFSPSSSGGSTPQWPTGAKNSNTLASPVDQDEEAQIQHETRQNQAPTKPPTQRGHTLPRIFSFSDALSSGSGTVWTEGSGPIKSAGSLETTTTKQPDKAVGSKPSTPTPLRELPDASESDNADGDDDELPGPIFEVPNTWPKRIMWGITLPLMIMYRGTIPDARFKDKQKFIALSFFASMMHIGIASFFMVWWATVIGQFIYDDPKMDAVMGLTFLAAGTSIPDLMSSVIVARQGLGDMAVSSSIGSNIFDILIGLPLPWLIKTLASGSTIALQGGSIIFSVSALIVMLALVLGIIVQQKWAMTKVLGGFMFILYFIFLAFSLLVEFDIIF